MIIELEFVEGRIPIKDENNRLHLKVTTNVVRFLFNLGDVEFVIFLGEGDETPPR